MTLTGPLEAAPAIELCVVAAQMLTATIRELCLVPTGLAPLPPFTPGAHIEVQTGNGAFRAYSLVSDPGEMAYRIAVHRAPDWLSTSQYMHDFVGVGARLKARAPKNGFALAPEPSRSVLIAGGIGITPILSMARALRRSGAPFKVHYVGRSRGQMAYVNELLDLCGAGVQLHLTTHTGRPDVADLMPPFEPGLQLYVCGPSGLVQAVRQAAADWPPDALRFELFVNSDGQRRPIAEPAEPFEVELARSGRVLTVGRGETLLDALLASGLSIPASCTSGICGTCVVPLLSGAVDHRDVVLTDAERCNRLQTCCSRAQPGERLVLDR